MNGQDIAEKAAASAWFTIVGRSAMLGTMGLVGWLLQAVGTLQTDVKVLTNTVNFTMSDRYRGDDAKRDFALRDNRLDSYEARLRELEHEVRSTKIDVKEQAIQTQEIQKAVPKRVR
jgi:hypothetical protein